jgi:hypothetical protein
LKHPSAARTSRVCQGLRRTWSQAASGIGKAMNRTVEGHFSAARNKAAVAGYPSRCLTRAKRSFFLPTNHRRLPETANRVETHLTHRKQSIRCRSTRDALRRLSVHQNAHSSARRSAREICAYPFNVGVVSTAHQLPLTAHWPLIGTPERLETCLSYRKESTADRSNRYSLHAAFRAALCTDDSPANSASCLPRPVEPVFTCNPQRRCYNRSSSAASARAREIAGQAKRSRDSRIEVWA